ncbi:Crp/Fnr family transcriptional regulator [Methylobacterium pseudosasicola]|uniref:cAMP-binding domain of CRP or a regulatory subunit of cAMP-dependent protein kinases n=1 Tax=Methylobacterium pseudosasicola TaxID=582667 RepID=A0A1I4RYC4_9HYPH|nr:Crp/Fnr family transcriptional regulator [Methylobacterium pseudosasicola]SFM57245.1 cAMP-binding domain of CRP or a regulatory subunit of cAMP-dependent protein kinases [Methylobacterium pseudosasicola]
MAPLQQPDVRNKLLAGLSPEDFASLQSALRLEPMQLRQVLIPAHSAIEVIYFPEEGFVSITADGAHGRVEIGLVGREGVVGAGPTLLGDDRSPHTHFVQMAGHMLSIDAEVLRAAFERLPSLRRLIHRYIQAQHVQTAQTAFANARGTTPTRLARWLLMCHDRIDGDMVTVTHEFMSFMLGVERPGVTAALRSLETDGLVRKHRGRVEILDRDGLLDLAGDSYGGAEAEYARLIEGRPEPID